MLYIISVTCAHMAADWFKYSMAHPGLNQPMISFFFTPPSQEDSAPWWRKRPLIIALGGGLFALLIVIISIVIYAAQGGSNEPITVSRPSNLPNSPHSPSQPFVLSQRSLIMGYPKRIVIGGALASILLVVSIITAAVILLTQKDAPDPITHGETADSTEHQQDDDYFPVKLAVGLLTAVVAVVVGSMFIYKCCCKPAVLEGPDHDVHVHGDGLDAAGPVIVEDSPEAVMVEDEVVDVVDEDLRDSQEWEAKAPIDLGQNEQLKIAYMNAVTRYNALYDRIMTNAPKNSRQLYSSTLNPSNWIVISPKTQTINKPAAVTCPLRNIHVTIIWMWLYGRIHDPLKKPLWLPRAATKLKTEFSVELSTSVKTLVIVFRLDDYVKNNIVDRLKSGSKHLDEIQAYIDSVTEPITIKQLYDEIIKSQPKS